MHKRRLFLGFGGVSSLDRIYVKPSGSSIGWDLQTQYLVLTDIQQAIDMVNAGGEIWISAGTYKAENKISTLYSSQGDYETNTSNYHGYYCDKSISFYGGFAGNESATSEADPTTNQVILDGDILGNDIQSEWAWKILYIYNTTNVIVSGITFQKCNAPGSMNNFGSHIVKYGGAISFVISGTLTLIDVELTDTDGSTYGYGSALMSWNSTSVVATNVHSHHNYPNAINGAIYIYLTTSTWNNCEFNNNATTNYGGALYFYAGSNHYITNCLFYQNSSGTRGTTICARSGCNVYIKTSTIRAVGSTSLPTLGTYTTATLANFYVYNSIVVNGYTYPEAGGHYAIVTWYNSNVEGSGGSDAWVHGAYSIDGGGNIDENSRFVDESIYDLRLSGKSPCIDTGNNSYNSASTDYLGNTREIGLLSGTALVDMGCYETFLGQDGQVFLKPSSGSTAWSGLPSQTNVYTDLQDIIDLNIINLSIHAAAGTYKPSVKDTIWSGQADYATEPYRYLAYQLPAINVIWNLKGGYTGTETNFIQSDPINNESIFSGDITGNETFSECVDKLFDFMAPVGCRFIFDYVTLEWAFARANTGNTAIDRGALVHIHNSSVKVDFTNVTFKNTDGNALGYGTAVNFNYSTGDFTDCTFQDINTGLDGTIYSYYRDHNFTRCKFIDIHGDAYGSAVYSHGNTQNFYDCLFVRCNTPNRGQVLSGRNSAVMNLYNCTFYLATGATPAFSSYNANATDVTYNIYNGIVQVTDPATDYAGTEYGTINYYNSLVVGSGGSSSWTLTETNTIDQGANIDGSPGFTDDTSDDFTLLNTSICIDAGNNSYNDQVEDLIGNPRIVDGDGDFTDTIDLGCYEYQP